MVKDPARVRGLLPFDTVVRPYYDSNIQGLRAFFIRITLSYEVTRHLSQKRTC